MPFLKSERLIEIWSTEWISIYWAGRGHLWQIETLDSSTSDIIKHYLNKRL